MDNIPTERLAYLAGFLDGEGCVRCVLTKTSRCLVKGMYGAKPGWKRYPYHQVHIYVYNNAHEPLELFKSTFGGFIYQRKDCRGLKWQATSAIAMRTLRLLLPYLILKKPQALAAVELAEGLHHRGRKPTPPEEWERREAIRIKILDLNSRYNSHGLTLRKRHAYTTV